VLLIERPLLYGTDYWTSGTDAGCAGKLNWCAIDRRFTNRNMTWANSAGGGECVSVKFSISPNTFSRTDCNQKLNYICEVGSQIVNKLFKILFNVFCRSGTKELSETLFKRNA